MSRAAPESETRVGRGPEQGQVLRERAGRERRRRTGRLVAEHLALAVDEPAQDTTAHHVEDGLARQPERVATGQSPTQRRQRVAEHPVGDELEPGRLGRTAEHQRLAQPRQHVLDLGRRLATGEDRQPAGGDGRGRTHDRRMQVRRAGRRHQDLQRRRLVGADGGGVHDGRPGGQRRQARGEHLAAGRAVVQAEQHHVGALHRDGGRAHRRSGSRCGRRGRRRGGRRSPSPSGRVRAQQQRSCAPAWLAQTTCDKRRSRMRAMRFRHDGSCR